MALREFKTLTINNTVGVMVKEVKETLEFLLNLSCEKVTLKTQINGRTFRFKTITDVSLVKDYNLINNVEDDEKYTNLKSYAFDLNMNINMCRDYLTEVEPIVNLSNMEGGEKYISLTDKDARKIQWQNDSYDSVKFFLEQVKGGEYDDIVFELEVLYVGSDGVDSPLLEEIQYDSQTD